MDKSTTAPKRSYAAYVLFMMLCLYMVNYIDRAIVSGLVGPIKESFGVSDTFMGFLMGPAFAVFYTTAAIPIARLADRYSRIRIISIGAIVWSFFTVLCGLSVNEWMFAAARIGVGIGEAAFLAPAYSLLSDYFPARKRGTAFAILNLGVYFGQIGGLMGGAAIEKAYDWQTAFLVLGAPGIALGLLAWLTVREPERGRLDDGPKKDSTASFWKVFPALWQAKSYRYMVIGGMLGGFGGVALANWGPELYLRAFNVDQETANASYGLAFMISGLTGVIAMGAICDRLAPRDAAWPLRLSAIGVLGSMLAIIAVAQSPSLMWGLIFAVPAGLFGGGWVVALQSSLQDLLPGTTRATGTSFWAFCFTLAGFVLGTQFASIMIDALRPAFGEQSIRHAITLTFLTCIPAGWLLWQASKSVLSDAKPLAARIAEVEKESAEAAAQSANSTPAA